MPLLNIPYRHVQYLEEAKPGISKHILAERWLETTLNSRENPAMLALFDIYMEYIPGSRHYDDETCYTCREKVLSDYRLMLPYLKRAAGLPVVDSDFRDVSYRDMYNKTFDNVK